MISLLITLSLLAQVEPPPRSFRACEASLGYPVRSASSLPACTAVIPDFQLAPASGAGMGNACNCTAITGSKGETITFTRASTGTCTKGDIRNKISVGDLVVCGNNFPRVMPGADGGGPLGLDSWEARTNVLHRSSEFDNGVAWFSDGTGSSVPTVQANAALSPFADAGMIADLVTFAATGASSESVLGQLRAAATSASISIYVRGYSDGGTYADGGPQGFGTIDNCSSTGGAWTCSDCVYERDYWTRCVRERGAAVDGEAFGNDTVDNGGISRPAQAVYLFGAQAESGRPESPYIPTAGASATRAVELATFTPAFTFASAGSAAGTLTCTSQGGVFDQGANARFLFVQALTSRIFDGTTTLQTSSGTFTPYISNRIWSSWATDGGMTVSNSTISSTTNGAFDGALGAAGSVNIGRNVGGVVNPNGTLKLLCMDSRPTVCR